MNSILSVRDRTDACHPENASTLGEFLSECEGILHVWRDRAKMEAAVWADFVSGLDRALTLDEALSAYTAFVDRRLKMSTENTQRIFEEYRKVVDTFGVS